MPDFPPEFFVLFLVIAFMGIMAFLELRTASQELKSENERIAVVKAELP